MKRSNSSKIKELSSIESDEKNSNKWIINKFQQMLINTSNKLSLCHVVLQK